MNVPIRLDEWSNKEYQKIVNSDYKYNGVFWMYQGKFIDFLKSIDNKFFIKKISWLEEDFLLDFGGFYGYHIYLREKIGKPYIAESLLDILSYDYEKVHRNIICIENEQFNPMIDRCNYFNLYDIGFINGSKKFNGMPIFHYDMRIDKLYNTLKEKDIFNEIQNFLLDYSDDMIEKIIKNEFVRDFLTNEGLISYNNIVKKLNDTDKNLPQGWNNTLAYSADLQIDLCSLFLVNFNYREELSGKKFKVFTKKIDDGYQWALLLNGDMVWGDCFTLLLIVKNDQNKPISPKDVVYQEHLLFLYGNMQHLPKTRESLSLQCYKYIFLNRHINRYIDYMQDKIMAVIYNT